MAGQLTAGAGRVVITPPVGINLSGFAGRAPSNGVHDDLYATALVLSEERDHPVALVTLDLLGMYGDDIGPAIKDRVQAVTGIPPERVDYRWSPIRRMAAITIQAGAMKGV